uniref:Uncharacterized protein n=1 Tax=Oxyrrhis marina TaxID=2969 RepID=A0A7S3UK11_OXYMA
MSEGDSAMDAAAGDEITRSDSALRANIKEKGANSYYYAHAKPPEIPAHAKVVSGPGLITGGPPELISRDESIDKPAGKPRITVTKFSWLDDGDKVKIYVEAPEK